MHNRVMGAKGYEGRILFVAASLASGPVLLGLRLVVTLTLTLELEFPGHAMQEARWLGRYPQPGASLQTLLASSAKRRAPKWKVIDTDNEEGRRYHDRDGARGTAGTATDSGLSSLPCL